jgi:anti-sigma factor RsiW
LVIGYWDWVIGYWLLEWGMTAMCENRERLIGYVYDECDAAERQVIEGHLSSCPTCRHEISGLRSVRQDLLAWDVPLSEPVWRPIPVPRQESPWRTVPAWAMAAAAGAILAVGAAGGAAMHALLPAEPAAVAQAPQPAVAVPVAVSHAELAALEERMVARLRQEFEDRVRTVSAASVQPTTDAAELARRVTMLTARQDEMFNVLYGVATQTEGIRRQQTGLEHRSNLLVSLMREQGSAQTSQGGR